jgi:hypothetical protein
MFPTHTYLTPWKLAGALLSAGVGAALIVAWPDAPADISPAPAIAQASADEAPASAQESACEKQAWPYIDSRCADMAAKTPDQATRQVRVVSTDRGTSSVIVTPVASLAPPPQNMPLRAAAAEETPQRGPSPLPQPKAVEPVQNIASAPAPQFVANAMAVEEPATTAPVAEKAPAAPEPGQKAARTPKVKTAAKTNDKRSKPIQLHDQNPKAVPAEVIAAVDAAETVRNVKRRANEDQGGRQVIVSDRYSAGDGEAVAVSYRDRPAQRIFLVPREEW